MNKIYYRAGRLSGSIPEAIAFLKPPTPVWSWYEPMPGSLLKINKRADDLHPLLRPGAPEFFEGVSVDEARLFWPDGSLHLLRIDQEETRYYWWSINEIQDGQSTEYTEQKAYQVLLRDRKEYSRFSLELPTGYPQDALEVIEYWFNTSLIAWTVTDSVE